MTTFACNDPVTRRAGLEAAAVAAAAGELVVMAANLDANAVRIDLVGLTAKGIEFA